MSATLTNSTSKQDLQFEAENLQPVIENLEAKKQAVIAGLSDYIRYTFHELGAHSNDEAYWTLKDISDLEDMDLSTMTTDELRKKKTEIENHYKWLQMSGGIKSQREKIQNAWIDLNVMLNSAVRSGAISEKSKTKWIHRFKDGDVGAGAKIQFVKLELPLLLTRAEREAEKRKQLLKDKNISKITPDLVENISDFTDQNTFLTLHYLEREDLNAKVTAALAAIRKNLPKLHSEAKSILMAAVASGAMSKNKVGKWLESLFAQERSLTEIRSILTGDLKEYIGTWTKLRYRYDRLERAMEKKGVPPGINRLSPQKFLDKDFFERENYVQEAEYAMNLLEKGFSDRPIDKMKLEIRSLIAQKDWEGAKAVIAKAYIEAKGEDIYELKSMENTIRLSMPSGPEATQEPEQPATQILEDMRAALFEVPSSVRGLYIQALHAGPQVFSSMCTLLFNRVWCWNNGYLSDELESGSRQRAQDETKDVIEHGHKPKGLENIDLDTVDEIQKAEAMRPYDKTWAPTLIHLDASNGSSCGALLNELSGKVEARDYWSTLIIKNITYEKQRELVIGVNYRLKSGIRKLAAAGHGFSLTGKITKEAA